MERVTLSPLRRWEPATAPPTAELRKHGRPKKGEKKGSVRTFKRGDNATYIRARLQRDHPEIAESLDRGEFRSARAAAIEAGDLPNHSPAPSPKPETTSTPVLVVVTLSQPGAKAMEATAPPT